MVGPLAGVRVVDLTTVVAGPYATLLLADLGAEVIKVESPTGDIARDLGPRANPDMAAVFLNCNRGKRSVVLDLYTADGQRALKQLCDRSDVFVGNLRTDSAARCGADATTLRAGHHELVHCSIRGFGSAGPYRDLPAYDDIIQAASGIAGAQEWMAGNPTYVVTAVGDKVAGLTAAFAVTAALHQRTLTGEGCAIEVPMAESLTTFGLLEHLWGRTFVPPRGEARYPRMASPRRRPFATSDGFISVVVYTDRNWERFFDIIGRPHRTARRPVRPDRGAPEAGYDGVLVRTPQRSRHSRGAVQPRRGSLRRSAFRSGRALGNGRASLGGHAAAMLDAHHLRR
jgi:crotonobetainyl-CoA:carnitine CoA-transferase CaiB-like acyl-CoA transferase